MSESTAILARVASKRNGKFIFESVTRSESWLPLSCAHLCQSCDTVCASAIRCPVCNSQALLSIAEVLNR
jgi:hypothetical protein